MKLLKEELRQKISIENEAVCLDFR